MGCARSEAHMLERRAVHGCDLYTRQSCNFVPHATSVACLDHSSDIYLVKWKILYGIGIPRQLLMVLVYPEVSTQCKQTPARPTSWAWFKPPWARTTTAPSQCVRNNVLLEDRCSRYNDIFFYTGEGDILRVLKNQKSKTLPTTKKGE